MSRSKGCVKSLLGGCFSVLVFFVFLGIGFSFISKYVFDLLSIESNNITEEVTTGDASGKEFYSVSYQWDHPEGFFQSSSYRLTFHIPKHEVDNAMKFLTRISRMTYDEIGVDETVYYYDSIQFYCEYWRIVYGKIIDNNSRYINPIRRRLNEIMDNNNMTSGDKVNFLISFVQNIDYKIPEVPLGVMPPISTLKAQYADCDSKALLLYLLLEGLSVPCVIFYSPYYQHAMLGLDYTGLTDRKVYGGDYYYFLETTYPGWEIGQLPPEMKNTDLWYVLDLKNI
ncbi:MAG: hypothetical protein HUU54_09445 [Ignavibacteriaceae bacterium]|nr:hypothetical protein [Ignavibacteriaceae bacterium]